MYEDKSVMPGSLGYDNADVHNMFMQGKVAMVKNWPYMYAMAKDPEQSAVSDKFAVAVQPQEKSRQPRHGPGDSEYQTALKTKRQRGSLYSGRHLPNSWQHWE